jgi:hypothetical protein
MYDGGREARKVFRREERGVGMFYNIMRSVRPRLWLCRNNGEVCVAKSFVHIRPKDACEVSDVNGQGYLATEFWLRQSSSLEVGVKKITIFISGARSYCVQPRLTSARRAKRHLVTNEERQTLPR